MTILHLGDSHTAADHFSGHLRALFQDRFGRGPRGMLPPGAIHEGYAPHQVRLSSRGGWQLFDAWRHPDRGPYGLSGYRLVGDTSGARLDYEVVEDDAFSRVRLGLYGSPQTGRLVLAAEGGERVVIDTRMAEPSYVQKVVRLKSMATRLTLSPAGDGPVTLLSVGLERPGSGGVTYVSHGVPGATVALLARLDEEILKRELAVLDPALIILAFGTNEGFNDALDPSAYGRLFTAQTERIARLVPGARIALAGPPDGNRLLTPAEGQGAGDRPHPCLKEPRETAGAEERAYWSVPRKLEAVREVQRQVAAAQGLVFWDWSAVMGGPCGMHEWANAVPPRAFPDHVHMTGEGAAVSARRFFDALLNSHAEEWGPLPRAAGEDVR